MNELGKNILQVLAVLQEPLEAQDILSLLEPSFANASIGDVRDCLERELKGRVELRDGNRWVLLVPTFDPEQRRVIEADADVRMVVVAGPGAGKTEVACARIAHLVDRGLSPASVLVLSFTRAATAEMRQRVVRNSLEADRSVLTGVEIRTLDSIAWLLQRYIGHRQEFKSYSENIADTLEMLAAPSEALREYLESIQLLVIDEAQDLVGTRAQLTMSLIDSLSRKAGVLVLIDPAQAIYGDWAVEEAERGPDLTSFEDLLNSRPDGEFQTVELSGLHRTQDPTLITVAKELRVFAIAKEVASAETYEDFRTRLTGIAGNESLPPEGLPNLASPKAEQFFLFRTHGEAVAVSSYLSQAMVNHRLRFPGLPKPVHPWIGHLLWNYTGRELNQPRFMDLWKTNLRGTWYEDLEPAECWELLTSVAPTRTGKAIDVLYLREAIDRAVPPDELCLPAVGMEGPILGTIHGSKGREADEVVLFFSENKLRPNTDYAEETRVLYVGATRAKRSLKIAGFRSRQGYLKSRRAWATALQGGGFQVEFGLAGDVDPLSPVSKVLGGDSHAISLQQRLAQKGCFNNLGSFEWVAQREAGWARVIHSTKEGIPIGFCGKAFENDLWELAKRVHRRPPNWQRHLYVIGFTTVARGPTSPDLNQVTNSFAASGFWVAPIIKGYSIVIPEKGGRRW